MQEPFCWVSQANSLPPWLVACFTCSPGARPPARLPACLPAACCPPACCQPASSFVRLPAHFIACLLPACLPACVVSQASGLLACLPASQPAFLLIIRMIQGLGLSAMVSWITILHPIHKLHKCSNGPRLQGMGASTMQPCWIRLLTWRAPCCTFTSSRWGEGVNCRLKFVVT